MHRLFLMVGYPGAGKTTVARIVTELIGVEHIWTAQYRKDWFGTPSFRQAETKDLYDRLNTHVEEMLRSGKDVLFDTSFNMYADRERLSAIAHKHDAETVVIWVQTPKEVARKRAVESDDTHAHIRILGNMDHSDFSRLSDKLEVPRKNENVLVIDGSNVTHQQVATALKQHGLLQ